MCVRVVFLAMAGAGYLTEMCQWVREGVYGTSSVPGIEDSEKRSDMEPELERGTRGLESKCKDGLLTSS